MTIEQTISRQAEAVPQVLSAENDPVLRAMSSLGLFPGRRTRRSVTLTPRSSIVRVAIADDDPLARLAIEAMVRRGSGLAFVGAAIGVEEIIEVADSGRATAVVLDWLMPDGGGVEAARRIRAANPAIGIVALTAGVSHHAVHEMRRAGAAGVLAKGCSSGELSHAIHGAIAAAG